MKKVNVFVYMLLILIWSIVTLYIQYSLVKPNGWYEAFGRSDIVVVVKKDKKVDIPFQTALRLTTLFQNQCGIRSTLAWFSRW